MEGLVAGVWLFFQESDARTTSAEGSPGREHSGQAGLSLTRSQQCLLLVFSLRAGGGGEEGEEEGEEWGVGIDTLLQGSLALERSRSNITLMVPDAKSPKVPERVRTSLASWGLSLGGHVGQGQGLSGLGKH